MKCIGKMALHTSAEIEKSFVSIGFETLDRDMFNAEKCYGPLGQTGIKYARCQTGWIKCEKEKGVYDFAWLDDIVNNLLKEGVEPWFSVTFGNPLYMDNISNPACVGCIPILYGDEAMEAWLNYARRLTEHFKDRVTHYEIWNEPDCNQFWYPGTCDAAMYARVVTETGSAVREVMPECKIGACMSRFNFDYFDKFASSISDGDIDFMAVHTYGICPELNYTENIKNMRRILKRYGINGVEIWQGESGCPSHFPKNHWLNPKNEGSERQQAVWQLRRYFLDASQNLALSSFFQMADMWENRYIKAREALDRPAPHGILNGLTYTPKKSFETISRLANFFSGDIKPFDNYFAGGVDGDTLAGCASRCMAFEKDGCAYYAYYVPYDLQDEEPIRRGFWVDFGNSDKNRINNPVLLDMYNGCIYEIENYENTETMMRITDLPYCDYPMVICDRNALEIIPAQ